MMKYSGHTLSSANHPVKQPKPPQRRMLCPVFFVCHFAPILKRRFPSSCRHLRRPAGRAMRAIIMCPMGHPGLTACRSC